MTSCDLDTSVPDWSGEGSPLRSGGLSVNKPTWPYPHGYPCRLFSFDAKGSLHCRMTERLR